MPTPPSLIAAVVPHGSADADGLIEQFAASLIHRGWRVRGLVQETSGVGQLCEITLVDLADGSRHPITQDLGSCSTACRLDPAAMTEAGAAFRRIARDGADLVVFNRFGKQEADGRGFAAEMLAVMSCDIPVLTLVQGQHLDAWRQFTGGLSVELPAEQSALENWFACLAARSPL